VGYAIKRGDSIEVTVWGYPEFGTKTVVREGGIIIVPLVGELAVAGMTKEEFQKLIKQRLSEYVKGDARIIVSVVSLNNQRVTVIGAVTRQDNFPLMSEASVVEVLSSAGGSTPESDLHHVKIIRSGKSEDPIEVDLGAALENGTVDRLPKVRPGDTVFVPKNENVIREFSDFLRDAVLIFGFFTVVH
jgi:polysaccharide export outer membrane protein